MFSQDSYWRPGAAFKGLSGRLAPNVEVEAHARWTARRDIEPGELLQRDILERTADGGIDALPGSAHTALPLDPALAGGAGALRDRNRTLEHVEDLRRRDLP